MTIIERLFNIKSKDSNPYCPRAFLTKIYHLAYNNQGFIIYKIINEQNLDEVIFVEIQKGKIVIKDQSIKKEKLTEIIGSLESLKTELKELMD